jgi:quaternary ammonium compound-resistance protein SugE
MAWILLAIAGLSEVGWAIGMKYSEGLSRLWPSVATILVSIFSFVLLARAMRTLPVGTSYAVWTGIGAVGSAILGILLFHESGSPARLACIALIVVGIVGLKLTASQPAP